MDIFQLVILKLLDLCSFWVDFKQYFWGIGLDCFINNYVGGMQFFDFLISGKLKLLILDLILTKISIFVIRFKKVILLCIFLLYIILE